MKKTIIVVLSALVLASCSPKRANTTTAQTSAPIFTTTAIKTQPLNNSNTSNASNNVVTVKSTNAGQKTKPEATKAENKSTKADNNNNGNNNDSESKETTEEKFIGDSEENETANGNESEAVNNDDENQSQIADINEAKIDIAAVDVDGEIIELPAKLKTFENSGFELDMETAKYSESDALTYVKALFNGEPVLIGYDEASGKVSEIEFSAPTGIKIPGGFTVGDSLQSFHDEFGYWGGDIYKIDNAEYTVSGSDLIESIKVRYVE